MKTKYKLQCTQCSAEYEPDPFRLTCDVNHGPSLLRTVYSQKKLEVKEALPGLFRYIDWLPIENHLQVESKPITYESKKLAHHLGLTNLFISFNGYWPERNAHLFTCSFKELEAAVVLARIPKGEDRTLVIASAGNTGSAFASLCSQTQTPLYLVIPERSLSAICSKDNFGNNVRLISAGGNCDYFDAICLGQEISKLPNFFTQGGTPNVARRDGMGLTVVDAVLTMGRIPDHYFQAVGSGSGGIAAWEANLKFLEEGLFGTKRMKLHLAQNSPFTPMVDAWKAHSQEIFPIGEEEAKERIGQVSAQVLTTRKPAYSITGGVYDALVDTNGEMYRVNNAELERARALFAELEGIDISSSAGVALNSLIQAVEVGTVQKNDYVLLNITSGGMERLKQDYPLQYLQPSLTFSREEILPELVSKRIQQFAQSNSTGQLNLDKMELPYKLTMAA